MSRAGVRALLVAGCLVVGLLGDASQEPVVTGGALVGPSPTIGPLPVEALAAEPTPAAPGAQPTTTQSTTTRGTTTQGTAGTVPVRRRGDGSLTRVPVAAGGPKRSAAGRRYTVAVEGGLGIDASAFAAAVERVLTDSRSWGRGEPMVRVADGPVAFRLVLASPATTDRLCAPLQTNGRFSCASGSTAVVNSMRWLTGAPAYAGRLDDYRAYVVNPEVGHTLGRGHASCPGRGLRAPVMMQQTKGVGTCRAEPWPYP